jgi:hypothetical protein
MSQTVSNGCIFLQVTKDACIWCYSHEHIYFYILIWLTWWSHEWFISFVWIMTICYLQFHLVRILFELKRLLFIIFLQLWPLIYGHILRYLKEEKKNTINMFQLVMSILLNCWTLLLKFKCETLQLCVNFEVVFLFHFIKKYNIINLY